MNYFKEFMEDYNTATMPHEKFYNFEKWEMEEYRRKSSAASSSSTSSSHRPLPESFNDEEERRKELQLRKQREEQKEFVDFSRKCGVVSQAYAPLSVPTWKHRKE